MFTRKIDCMEKGEAAWLRMKNEPHFGVLSSGPVTDILSQDSPCAVVGSLVSKDREL